MTQDIQDHCREIAATIARQDLERAAVLLAHRVHAGLVSEWEDRLRAPRGVCDPHVECATHGQTRAAVVGDQVYKCGRCVIEALPPADEILSDYLQGGRTHAS